MRLVERVVRDVAVKDLLIQKELVGQKNREKLVDQLRCRNTRVRDTFFKLELVTHLELDIDLQFAVIDLALRRRKYMLVFPLRLVFGQMMVDLLDLVQKLVVLLGVFLQAERINKTVFSGLQHIHLVALLV